jgi:hypothetical protein
MCTPCEHPAAARLSRIEHTVALHDRASLALPFMVALREGVGREARPGTSNGALRRRLIAHM